jgi:outer membrane lipoprotein carrier protein
MRFMRVARWGTALLVCAVAAVLPPAASRSDDTEALAKRIQTAYDAIKDFKAHFVQESSIKSWNAEQVQKAEGTVYLKKGGKMFWDYQSPTPQQIICDGRQLWFYEPEDKQVMVTTVGEGLQSQVSADLLNGKAQLARDFTIRDITSPSDREGGCYVLELIPRAAQPNLSKIILRADRNTFQIKQTEVYDLFDNLTRISFSRVEIDTLLSDALFTFITPPGVESVAPPALPLPDRKP